MLSKRNSNQKGNKKVLYLHVGLHKTGTSALQYFFTRNRDALERHGICYPKTGSQKGMAQHHLMSSIRIPEHPHYPVEMKFGEYLKFLQEEVRNWPSILISSEILSEGIDQDKLQLLNGVADKIKIIVYLRRQDKYLESFFAERVQNGTFKKSFIENMNFSQMNRSLNYQVVCDYWAEKFGEENLLVRIYEKEQFQGGNIFSDFLSIFDINLEESSFDLPEKRINVSLSADELEYKRIYNALSNDRMIILPLSHSSDKRINDKEYYTYPVLSPENRKQLLELYRDSNGFVARNYLDRQDGQLFYETVLSKELYPYPGLTEERIVEITRFIENNNPKVFCHLYEVVQKGLCSENPEIREAAQTLQPGIRHVSKKQC